MAEKSIIILGRPDLENRNFGRTRAKRHPKFVYSNLNGLLIHEIAYVEFSWYDHFHHHVVRRNSPRLTVTTKCGQFFFEGRHRKEKRITMCELPRDGAMYCGRCQGSRATRQNERR